MRILYYDWSEFNGEDCRDAMRRLGHQVDAFKFDMPVFDLTPELDNRVKELASKKNPDGSRYYDLLFSFDFYPNISEACQKYDFPYVSWVFDCPHHTLYSHAAANPVNRIFVFDKLLCNALREKGNANVNHCPLGVNEKRLAQLCLELDEGITCDAGANKTNGSCIETVSDINADIDLDRIASAAEDIVYEHDVTFLGNLYDNEYNFYDQVKYLPLELKGYTDAVIKASERIFGVDLFTDPNVFDQDKIDELREYIKFEQTGKYEIDYDGVIRDILRKKVTVNERHNILAEMGKRFDTVLYTQPGTKPIEGVVDLGVANYITKMPRVFHRSKINLNITLRSILSGIPLRVTDILAAGGFLITSYQAEIAENFVDGEDLVIAYTPEDMIQKTAYYLAHDEERKQIALNGQRKAFENYAYTKLLPRVLGTP